MRCGRSRGERGTVTLWVLGLCMSVLALGGISVDLWRVVAVRRDLAAMADAAAAAGAGAADPVALRAGEVRIDPALARRLAGENLASQGDAAVVDRVAVAVDPAGTEVEVVLGADVELTLLRLFGGPRAPFDVEVVSRAEPRRLP